MSPNPMIDAGKSRHVPLTRRRLIGAGTLTALAADLLGTTTARAVAAAPAPLTLGTTTNIADLTAEVRWRAEHVRGLYAAEEQAEAALKATLSPDQQQLFQVYERAATSVSLETWDLNVAELCRHLPGLAAGIWAIWLHTAESQTGQCCVPDTEGFES